MESIDLTNSDDEGSCMPGRRCQGSARRNKQCGSSKSPASAEDVVDLTADTPPERRARSRGVALGKIAISFDDLETTAAGADGAARIHRKLARRIEDVERGRGFGTGSNGCSSDFGGSSSGASCIIRARESDEDPERFVSCPICNVEMKAGERISLACGHWACADCLTKRALDDGKCHLCQIRMSVKVMRKFLTEEQVNGTTEALRQQLLASDSNYIQCPNPTCGNVIERMELGSHDDTRELPRHAPDGQPLTENQAKHMQRNRFRCEACCSNFCAGCKALPYHTAATCQEAAAARCAAKCRFCQSQLPRGAKDGSSCGSAECDERLSTSCEVKLMCGHQCLGVFGESHCAPCLECADRADEFCNICWTEELRAAPCIRLRCGHLFHMHCVKERLKRRWPTPKISFTYGKCPLCNVWVDHAEVDGAMRGVHALRAKVEAAAFERYRIEGLAECAAQPQPDVSAKSASGQAGVAKAADASRDTREEEKGAAPLLVDCADVIPKDADKDLQKAMARYNFYLCVECKRPYFGGVAACGAVEEGAARGAGGVAGEVGAVGQAHGGNLAAAGGEGRDGRDELMCGSCSAKASGMEEATCARHKDQYIEFKCRFCCSIATFFCFGHTHFCEKCHQKWVNGACSNPSTLVQKCSCGQKHAPNGINQNSESCFGCSLCRIKAKEAAPI